MICYKVLKFADNKFYSSIYDKSYNFTNLFSQEYFIDKINYPRHKNTELFVFKDLKRAIDFAKVESCNQYKMVIWKCNCPKMRKIQPCALSIEYLEDFWNAVKKIRLSKKAVNYSRLIDSNVPACHVHEAYSTPYLEYVEQVWNC